MSRDTMQSFEKYYGYFINSVHDTILSREMWGKFPDIVDSQVLL